ncbi:AarF/ABC1/UbiB kinase family protein [Verrucomicrobiales bacterium BCK34]|nr:AarF/ABC1/UbiB kinase family protein [Verrucomicrobiales bacterium BCK34]
MRLRTLVRIDKSARRLAEIIGTLAKYGLDDWLSGVDYDWLRGLLKNAEGESIPNLTTAQRIRHALTDLGPTFVKAGQILSTRPDLIGSDLTAELSKLQSQAKADPREYVSVEMEKGLGCPIEDAFEEFSHEPIASASIGQVHKAVLPGGKNVVVKVMHKGIEEAVQRDLDLFLGLAELAEKHAPQLRRFQPLATARYFQRTLLRELDFSYERRHLEKFAENFRDNETVLFPSVYPELSSERVLTMELLEGIPVTDHEALKASGADLNEFARRGGDIYLEMIFGHGFYHADPHPGNLFRMPHDVVGVIDCGMVGHIDESLREEIEDMLLAAVSADAEGLCDAIVRVGQVPPELDEDELRAEVGEFLSDYVGRSVADFDVSGALQRLFDLVRDFHIVLPQSFGMLVKTLVVLEGTSRQLSPDFSLAAMIAPFYTRAVRRRLAPRRLASEMGRGIRDWKRLLEALPRDISDILVRFRKGTLEVHLEHRGLESTIDRLVQGLLATAMFLGSAIMWSMKAPPTIFGVSLFGALGFIFSTWLGGSLLLSIRRARKQKERK